MIHSRKISVKSSLQFQKFKSQDCVRRQYQFKRKSCEEQFNFNASLESKFSEIDSNLSNLSAESVVKTKEDSASEGKQFNSAASKASKTSRLFTIRMESRKRISVKSSSFGFRRRKENVQGRT